MISLYHYMNAAEYKHSFPFSQMWLSPMNNNLSTMPEVPSTLHSPQLSQPTPSLVKCLYQLGRWDGWETGRKYKEGGDGANMEQIKFTTDSND